MAENELKDGDSIRLQYFLVAFLDLLGQREQLRNLVGLPATQDMNDPIIQVLKRSLGAIHGARSLFRNFFEADSEESALMRSLSPDQRATLKQLTKSQVLWYGFSDSLIVAIPLVAGPDDPTPVNGVWKTLFAASGMATLSLACKHPVRGGIDVGIGVQISEREVYGAALERAYTLESRHAICPRILIGEELMNYLRYTSGARQSSAGARVAANQAESALRMIFKDWDGRWALDFLGKEFHEISAGYLPVDTVQQAYGFACTEALRWRSANMEDRAQRYDRLCAYFRSRAELWRLRDQWNRGCSAGCTSFPRLYGS